MLTGLANRVESAGLRAAPAASARLFGALPPACLRSALHYLGCFHVEAGKIDPMEFYQHARHYVPNVVVGEPSWMVRMSEIAAREGTWPVKLLIAGGETITHAGRQIVEHAWK